MHIQRAIAEARSFTELRPIAEKTVADFSVLWGDRTITALGYEGTTAINAVAARALELIKAKPNVTDREGYEGYLTSLEIDRLDDEVDAKAAKETWLSWLTIGTFRRSVWVWRLFFVHDPFARAEYDWYCNRNHGRDVPPVGTDRKRQLSAVEIKRGGKLPLCYYFDRYWAYKQPSPSSSSEKPSTFIRKPPVYTYHPPKGTNVSHKPMSHKPRGFVNAYQPPKQTKAVEQHTMRRVPMEWESVAPQQPIPQAPRKSESASSRIDPNAIAEVELSPVLERRQPEKPPRIINLDLYIDPNKPETLWDENPPTVRNARQPEASCQIRAGCILEVEKKVVEVRVEPNRGQTNGNGRTVRVTHEETRATSGVKSFCW